MCVCSLICRDVVSTNKFTDTPKHPKNKEDKEVILETFPHFIFIFDLTI